MMKLTSKALVLTVAAALGAGVVARSRTQEPPIAATATTRAGAVEQIDAQLAAINTATTQIGRETTSRDIKASCGKIVGYTTQISTAVHGTAPRGFDIAGTTSLIDSEAIFISRRTRSVTIRRNCNLILASTDAIRLILGPDEPPPPTGGGGEPPPPTIPPGTRPAHPPTLHWCTPADVGATNVSAKPVKTAQYGFSLCDATDDTVYHAYDNAVLSTQYQGCTSPITLDEVVVQSIANPSTGVKKDKWGIRAFDVGFDGSGLFDGCTFWYVQEEHGNYMDMGGGHRWVNCLFGSNGDGVDDDKEGIGSQGIQCVYATPGTKRQHETRFYDGTQAGFEKWNSAISAHAWDPQWVFYCAFNQVGLYGPGTRQSYADSHFEGGPNPVILSSCYFKTHQPWTDPNGVARDCFGAVMAHSRLYFYMYDTYIEYKQGDRDVVQIWRCGDNDPATLDVYLRGDEVWAAQNVDIRPRPGDHIKIEGCKGDAPVLVSYNDVYTWETSPTWDKNKIIYQGVISQDLDLICP